MPQITAQLATPWGLGVVLWAAPVVTPWGTGATIWSTGGPYTAPPAPPGGTPTAPTTSALYTVAAANAYNLVHTLDVRDLRDDAVLPVDRVSIATDRDSIFWTLRASGGAALFAKLSTGQQPPRVRVTVDGSVWEFVVESVTRSRAHPSAEVAIEGRSLACAAGSPYQGDQTWAVEGDTTAAQIAAAANIFTELDVQWQLDDWPVPEGVFSFNGTPLAVVRRVAEAAGAVVQSQRASYGVTVRPRYPLLPNEWGTTAPELELPLAVVDAESFQLDDQPPYDGVVVAGQQQGVIGLVSLAGTTGAHQAPMVTDVLITDVIAARQRGQAILGRSGKQQIHTITLPLAVAGGVAVVPDPGWLVRVVDTPPWVGLVTAVQLNVELPKATLGLTLERHTQLVDGTAAAPPITNVLTFAGPIPNLEFSPGAAVDVALAGYWSGGEPPFVYSLRSGTLPAWLTLNSSTGRLVGTAPGAPETSAPLAVRATDSIDSTADSGEFTVAVAQSFVDVVRATFEGTNGQTVGVPNLGTAGGTFSLTNGASLSTVAAASGASSLRVVQNAAAGLQFMALLDGFQGAQFSYTTGVAVSLEFRVRVEGAVSPDNREIFTLTLRPPQTPTYPRALLFAVRVGMRTSSSDVRVAFLGTESFPIVGTVGEPQDGGPGISKGVFHHLAISIDALGRYRSFVNGTLLTNMAPVTETLAPGTTVPMELRMRDGSVSAIFAGRTAFVDNIRIRYGFAYVNSFTPETSI